MAGTKSLFKTDPNLEANIGTEIDLGPAGVYTVLRWGGANKLWEKTYNIKTRGLERRIKKNTLPRLVAIRVRAEILSESIVINWRGVTDDDGNEIPYSKNACKELFLECPELMAEIEAEATDHNNFLLIDPLHVEAAVKNSQKSSRSKSDSG